MSKAGETVSFTYNADGLRVRKVATSTGVTNYTLHGKNVVHLTNGTNSLHFYYDAQNRPAVVEFNWVPYAYVHNLQGDIIAIVDANGNKVVEYKYDAWGKPIAKTGSLASTLGKWNPFRYRGYVYDEETGLYYLRSRYYNPACMRFLNADAIAYLVRDRSPLACNLVAYCKNSPVGSRDSNGRAQEILSMCANEFSEEVFGACFDVATANKNEIKGTLVKDVILLGGSAITIAVAGAIFYFCAVPFSIAMLGAGIITGPTTLVASLCANYYAEDYRDDGQGNHSVNDAEQWQNIGTAALIDYGGEMIGVVCQLSPTVDGAYTVVEYTVKISQIKKQGNDHYSSQKKYFRTPSCMNKLAVPTYLIR